MPKITPEELAQWVRENHPPPVTSEVVWFYCRSFEKIYENNRDLYEDRLEAFDRIAEEQIDPGLDQELAVFCLSTVARVLSHTAEGIFQRSSSSRDAFREASFLDKADLPESLRRLRQGLADFEDDLLVLGVELDMQARFRGDKQATASAAVGILGRLKDFADFIQFMERGAYAELATATALFTNAVYITGIGGTAPFAAALAQRARKE